MLAPPQGPFTEQVMSDKGMTEIGSFSVTNPDVRMSSANRIDVRSAGGPFMVQSLEKSSCARWRTCEPLLMGHAKFGGLVSIGGNWFQRSRA
jgi:hypothetical protein